MRTLNNRKEFKVLGSDKYGLYTLSVGESRLFPTEETKTTAGFYRVYNRIYVLASKKGIKISMTKTEGGMNVTRKA